MIDYLLLFIDYTQPLLLLDIEKESGNSNLSENKKSSATFQQHISTGLQQASKTYLEKRSWFHPLLNLHRVFEWHCVTFTVMACWAFSSQLVWDLSYFFKVASFVFWEIVALNLVWTNLEVCI